MFRPELTCTTRRSLDAPRASVATVATILAFAAAACVTEIEPPDATEESSAPILNGLFGDSVYDKPVVAVFILDKTCSGTFIHPNYILTAAHCTPVCDVHQPTGCFSGNTDDGVANEGAWLGHDGPTLGASASDGFTPGTGNRYTIDAIYYTPQSSVWGNRPPDVALLHTTTPSKFAPAHVLAAGHDLDPWTYAAWYNLPGYIEGFSGNDGATMGPRRYGSITMPSEVTISGIRVRLSPSFSHLTLYDPTTGSCNGDSGGPYFVRDGSEYRVAGVLSQASSSGCGHAVYPAYVPRILLDLRAQQDPACQTASWDDCVSTIEYQYGRCDRRTIDSDCDTPYYCSLLDAACRPVTLASKGFSLNRNIAYTGDDGAWTTLADSATSISLTADRRMQFDFGLWYTYSSPSWMGLTVRVLVDEVEVARRMFLDTAPSGLRFSAPSSYLGPGTHSVVVQVKSFVMRGPPGSIQLRGGFQSSPTTLTATVVRYLGS